MLINRNYAEIGEAEESGMALLRQVMAGSLKRGCNLPELLPR
jgi:hypothetical protein